MNPGYMEGKWHCNTHVQEIVEKCTNSGVSHRYEPKSNGHVRTLEVISKSQCKHFMEVKKGNNLFRVDGLPHDSLKILRPNLQMFCLQTSTTQHVSLNACSAVHIRMYIFHS